MKETNAQALLASVMDWNLDTARDEQRILSYFAQLKYDEYQQFSAGRRFIENLALWLKRLAKDDRGIAYDFIRKRLIYISNTEIAHLIQISYPDIICPTIQNIVASELGCHNYLVGKLRGSTEYKQALERSLYFGLSDGAHTHDLRRTNPQIKNHQVWQAYEPNQARIAAILKDARKACGDQSLQFQHIWLLDDFSASGLSYIRKEDNEWKGKIPRAYEGLIINPGEVPLADKDHVRVHILLYIATAKAINHLKQQLAEYCNSCDLTAPSVDVVFELTDDVSLCAPKDKDFLTICDRDIYYDASVEDDSTKLGGTNDVKRGFNACALPIILTHNTPNNSVFTLWAYDNTKVPGLFPRVTRHRG